MSALFPVDCYVVWVVSRGLLGYLDYFQGVAVYLDCFKGVAMVFVLFLGGLQCCLGCF